jgi:hypothetical protein
LKKNDRIADKQDFLASFDDESPGLGEASLVNFDDILKTDDLQGLANQMTMDILGHEDFMRKDILDRFLDFIYFKTQTGEADIPSMAYPTKRMINKEQEKKIIELINVHLYPEIVIKLLKFFVRNIHDSDTNLFIANLIRDERIIQSVYDTYRLIKKDIFIKDEEKRTLNVKRLQQFSSKSENKLSSPLDACARLKYILEFLALKVNVEGIYTLQDLALSSHD